MRPYHQNFAFDKSERRFDVDGRLHVGRSHISKATISPYYGREIPGYQSLGLVPDKIYQLYRDPAELKLAADTFARIPILSRHIPISADVPRPELIIGTVGSDVSFSEPYLDADLCFWASDAIAGIETNQVRELSCAYRYVPVMEPGYIDGKRYDGRMTQIQGNHVVTTEIGRAGSDVVVADSNPFYKDAIMRMTKLGKALFYAIAAASPVLGMDAALPALVGGAKRKDFKRAEVCKELLALDAEIDKTKLDNIIDAILDIEQDPNPVELNPSEPNPVADPAAEDPAAVPPPVNDNEGGSPADKLRALLAGKVDEETLNAALALMPQPEAPAAVNDEFPPPPAENDETKEDEVKKEDFEKAMDSLKTSMREAEEARRDVRPVVGEVIGMDSAAEVYGFALDHMKVDRKDVDTAPALRALFKLASSADKGSTMPRIAQDSGGLIDKFPGAARFRNI